MRAALLIVLAAGACGDSLASPPLAADATADAAAVIDAPPPPIDVDAAPPPARFVVMGDQGTGKPEQFAVAAALRELCATQGCDYVVLLGDNLYDGADSADDPIWQERFEIPYGAIGVPFHALLGNHDFGSSGVDVARSAHEVEYTARSASWRLPASHYAFTAGPVGFVMLDTTSIIIDNVVDGDQRAWWPQALAVARQAPWVIAAGHHPYRSNGHNGNADQYGPRFVSFMDDLVCGQVDLYLAGHDHGREWFDAPDRCGGTEMLISGAGGDVNQFTTSDTPVFWHDDSRPGFLYVVADAHRFTGRFIGFDGVVDYERTLTR